MELIKQIIFIKASAAVKLFLFYPLFKNIYYHCKSILFLSVLQYHALLNMLPNIICK